MMGIIVRKSFLFIALIYSGFIDAQALEVVIKAYGMQAPPKSAAIQTNDPCWEDIEALGNNAIIGCRGKTNNNAQQATIRMQVCALDESGNLTEDSIRALLAMGREFKDFFYYGDIFKTVKSAIAHRPL